MHSSTQVQELIQLAPECPEFPDLLSTIEKVCISCPLPPSLHAVQTLESANSC